MRYPEVGSRFVFLTSDCLEEDFAFDMDAGFRDLPVVGDNLAPLYLEGSPFFEAAEDSEGDLDVGDELAANGLDAILLALDDYFAGH